MKLALTGVRRSLIRRFMLLDFLPSLDEAHEFQSLILLIYASNAAAPTNSPAPVDTFFAGRVALRLGADGTFGVCIVLSASDAAA